MITPIIIIAIVIAGPGSFVTGSHKSGLVGRKRVLECTVRAQAVVAGGAKHKNVKD